MQDTEKREEHEEPLNASSDMHAPGSVTVEEEAAPAGENPAGAGDAPGAGEEAAAHAAGEDSIAEFADSVVSGLEQALAIEELEEPLPEPLPRSSGQRAETQDSFFAAWGGLEGASREEIPAQPQPEIPQTPQANAPSLRSLSEAGVFGDYNQGITGGLTKHDELADAVQSALLSVYGEPEPAPPIYQRGPQAEEPTLASLGRNKLHAEEPTLASLGRNNGHSGPGLPQPGDGLTPQDVILNYFDYTPETPATSAAPAYSPDDGLTPQEVILNYFDYPSGPEEDSRGRDRDSYGGPPAYNGTTPLTSRHRAEPVAPQQRSWQEHSYPSPRQERQDWNALAPRAAAQQYSGPPTYPVPAAATAAPASPKPPAGQENSRLLGAAAIGLMGGIAIAASLAAFLIYGPHPATVQIPGLGDLRIDRDDQGYGPGAQQEETAVKEQARAPRPAPVFTSEVIAADAVAAPGEPTPLSISIKSDQPFEKTLVSITGMPEGGRLSAGVDAGSGNWLLPPRRLTGLTISLPAGAPEIIPLEVQLLDSNARTPLSAKGAFAVHVKPASTSFAPSVAQNTNPPAPRPSQQSAPAYPFNTQTQTQPSAPVPAPEPNLRTQTQPAIPPAPAAPPVYQGSPAPRSPAAQQNAARAAARPEVEDLIREGNKRMRDGDILEARQFYQKAVALGDAEAALAMGRSFDPIYFARIEKKNAEPDAAKAFEWYRKAMDAGAAQTAMVRIENLKHFLNE